MAHRISLVVDDEPAIRKYIAAVLQRDDFQTLEAEDAAQGLEIVRELGEGVALVVSDIQMPGIDGLTFARAVKESHPSIAVVLVSGQAEPGAGFAFLRKPFPPGALLTAVERLMSGQSEAPIAN